VAVPESTATRGGSLVISSCIEKYLVVDYRKSIMAYERVIPIEACRDCKPNHYGTAFKVGDWESMPGAGITPSGLGENVFTAVTLRKSMSTRNVNRSTYRNVPGQLYRGALCQRKVWENFKYSIAKYISFPTEIR
jgi:hypothetical protein